MTCNCEKILSVSAKTSDTCIVKFNDGKKEHTREGYVPDIGLGSGDYLQFKVCVECGKIQGWKPLTGKQVIRAIKE